MPTIDPEDSGITPATGPMTGEGCWDAPFTKPAGAVKTVVVAAVALFDKDGRVLVGKRPEGKHMAGLWEFPGGKVQAGELPEVTCVRELKEELGIDITESCLAPFTFASHVYDDFYLLMPVFACRQWQGTPQAIEHEEIKWVRPSRLSGLAMPPADAPIVAMIQDYF